MWLSLSEIFDLNLKISLFQALVCRLNELNALFTSLSPADTDQAYYELIVQKAATLLSSVQVNMLKFALSLRAYSATVHSFQQVSAIQLLFVVVLF